MPVDCNTTILFFELIRVSIGLKDSLPLSPNEREWVDLYTLSKKQSLVGLCFAGVQKLKPQQQIPPEPLFLKWMGMAAIIEQRNKVVSKRCAEIQLRFADEGFDTAILKGQDYGRYYERLSALRQPGDIDLWVRSDMEKIIAFAKCNGIKIGHIDIKHSDMRFFADAEVEVHFRPSWMYCPKTDKRLQRWFEGFDNSSFEKTESGFVVPPLKFSLVFAMVHIYRHFFSEGIGLRQILDYYFLLQHSTADQRREAMCALKTLHMCKAVSGIMWVITYIFDSGNLSSDWLLCKPNETVGSFLLKEMMTSGNFGHDDTRFKHLDKSKHWQRGWIGMKRNMKYFQYFPEEVLWSPVWKVWHYCWRKMKGYL